MELTKQHFMKIYGQYLEPNTDINQKNILFKCPFHSDHNPSYAVSTDPTHPVGHCFSCSEKNSWIGFYQKTRNVDYKTALKELDMFDDNYKPQPVYVSPPEKHEVKKEPPDYSDYCYNAWANTIMHDKFYEFYGKKLYELRGITYDTAVACCIGYDKEKGWIFPFCRLFDNKCTGYEIRQKEFKLFDFNKSKCYKAKDSESCLSVVWRGWDNKKAIISEGFCDGIKLYQYLHERNQLKNKDPLGYVYETILTPTNGVKTVYDLVIKNKLWEQFEEVLFILDEDEAGRTVTEKLKQLAKQNNYNFKFFKGMPDGYDFEDYYENVLKKELIK